MPSLTKNDTVEKIETQNILSKKEASQAIETLLEILKSTLESGEDVMISGLVSSASMKKATRKGWNPATGNSMTLSKRRVVTFKCSEKLRDMVNPKN